jgi:tetraacyldisaccharide 4'-kinase
LIVVNLERSILQIIRGEKKAPVTRAFLAGLSLAYHAAINLRHLAYDLGLLPSTKLPIPVVSIGNLVAGGTGKTPLVHALATALQDKIDIAILSRGCKSKIEKSGSVKRISTGLGPLFSAEECGDEPYLLAQKTKGSVWVGIDRIESGRLAKKQGAKCLILDDGMQHRRLKRDFEIVVIDGLDPFARGRYLPWGLLRDSPKRLKKSSLIVISHCKDTEHFKQLKEQMSRFSKAPVVAAHMQILNPEQFIPRKVGVFCAIGQPARFLQTVRDLKSEIVDTLILNDHAQWQKEQLETFAKRCWELGAEALVCTEKDVVKLNFDISSLKILPVKIQMKITEGKEHWQQLINHILDQVVT